MRPQTIVHGLHARDLYPVPLFPGTRTGLVKWGHVDAYGYPDGPEFRGRFVVGCDLSYSAWLFHWLDLYPDADWAILTGRSGLLVVDVDVQHDGHRTLRELVKRVPLPATFTIRTRSGGCHLYYRTPKLAQSKAGALGQGLDVRSYKGLAVCPPTAGYSILDDRAITVAPPELVAMCPKVARASAASPQSRLPFDDPEAQRVLQHAVRRILDAAPGTSRSTVYGQSRYVFKHTDDDRAALVLLEAAYRRVSLADRRDAKRAITDARRKARGKR
jgi:hypothetical protein